LSIPGSSTLLEIAAFAGAKLADDHRQIRSIEVFAHVPNQRSQPFGVIDVLFLPL
jgi:hypothetical protein